MTRVLVTGSSEGLGLMAGQLLAEQGLEVVLHARNPVRVADARRALPSAAGVVEGDVATIAGMRSVAEQADALGPYDAVIHNVAVGYRDPHRIETADGLPQIFAVNVLAPFVLTALIRRPQRLIFLSSSMHLQAQPALEDLLWNSRRWNGATAYAESKLYDAMLAFAVARRWPDVVSTAVDPGWVPTRMGGPDAPGDIEEGCRTQVWLAVGDDPEARRSGTYRFHRRERPANRAAHDVALQDDLILRCEELSGVTLPN